MPFDYLLGCIVHHYAEASQDGPSQWMSMDRSQSVEGFKHDETLTELKEIYCTDEDIDMEDEDSPYALFELVPGFIRESFRFYDLVCKVFLWIQEVLLPLCINRIIIN